jgi:hypothetical protein
MNATYLRALASRCRTSGRNCSDLFAKEEFRHLASELDTRANELERPANNNNEQAGAWLWRRERSRGFEGGR